MTEDDNLTTLEAANILHVPLPHLVKLLDEGAIPHHWAGAQRRVRAEDILDYRRRRAIVRRECLAKLTQLSEDLPGGYH